MAANDLIVAVIVGPFAGAAFGYCFSLYQQKKDENKRQHGELIKIRHVLATQLAIVEGLKINHLEPLKNDRHRFAKLRATYFPKAAEVPLETSFLANSKNRNLLSEIYDAEQGYLKTMAALDMFNRFKEKLNNDYPPLPGTFNVEKASGGIIPSELDKALGNRYVTDLYDEVELSVPRLSRFIEKIDSIIVK